MKTTIVPVLECDSHRICELIKQCEDQEWRIQFPDLQSEMSCYNERVFGELDPQNNLSFAIFERSETRSVPLCFQGLQDSQSYLFQKRRSFGSAKWEALYRLEASLLKKMHERFAGKRAIYNYSGYVHKDFTHFNLRSQSLYESWKIAFDNNYDLIVKLVHPDDVTARLCKKYGFKTFAFVDLAKLEANGERPFADGKEHYLEMIYVNVAKRFNNITHKYYEFLQQQKEKKRIMIGKPNL